MGEPSRAYGDPVLGAFDLDFFDSGRRRRTALGSGWGVRFEDVPPVRGFRWNKGDRSFAGWYYAVTTGDHVGYESWLERDRLILLDFAPDVVGIASQQLREKIMSAPETPPPTPWRTVLDRRTPIGGLLGIGFAVAPDGDLIMVVSVDGHGLFDTTTGEKIARDRDLTQMTAPPTPCPISPAPDSDLSLGPE